MSKNKLTICEIMIDYSLRFAYVYFANGEEPGAADPAGRGG